jgi:hypothetical protein
MARLTSLGVRTRPAGHEPLAARKEFFGNTPVLNGAMRKAPGGVRLIELRFDRAAETCHQRSVPGNLHRPGPSAPSRRRLGRQTTTLALRRGQHETRHFQVLTADSDQDLTDGFCSEDTSRLLAQSQNETVPNLIIKTGIGRSCSHLHTRLSEHGRAAMVFLRFRSTDSNGLYGFTSTSMNPTRPENPALVFATPWNLR